MTYYNWRGQPMPESAPEQGRIAGTAAGGETMTAPAGATSVSGEGGGDLLIGSSGDNRLWITDPHDVVQEQPNGGIDTEIGWTSIKLAPNVENLTVNGAFNYAVGNSQANLIVVDDATHWLYGGAGDDVLVGGPSQKSTFIVKAGEGSDVIYNWNGNDQVQLLGYGFNTAAQIRGAMTQQGADTVLALPNGESLTFRGVTPGAFADRQFLLPLDTSKLGAMTFADEFNSLQVYNPSAGTGLWRADFGGNLKDQWAYTLVSNGEQQVYVQPGFQGRGEAALGINPFSVSNGALTISASNIPTDQQYAAWGANYSSGMLNTLGMFEQKYGYFEMRAEMPTSIGAWPAFWMMPHPFVSGVEADITEGLAATPNFDYVRAAGGTETQYDNTYKIDPAGFHTYGMLWTPSTVTFYYDGVAVLQGATPASWTQPMAMILNLAVGGWGGNPNAATFPANLKIDYVHAYALADGSTQVVHDTPVAPVATLHDDGATGGQANVPVAFADGGQPVTSANIQVFGAHPATLPPGKTFVIWEDSGAVFGAVSDGATLGKATALMAGTASQFTGAGTWLSDGKVAFSYLMPSASGHDAWAMVFDPVKLTFTRQDLGPATGEVHFVATAVGGFAVSWHAPDGTVQARGYDEYAYGGDVPGWYGPVRQVTGDFVGVTADGHVIAANGSGQELYDLMGASTAPGTSPGATPGATAGPDVLQASSSLTDIHAGAGNDTITGWSGRDTLWGDDGNDSIVGGSGFDNVNGNKGDDTIDGGSGGGDWLVGGQGNDLITSHASDDILYGNIGNDTLNGGVGSEIIRGGQNDDVLYGGAGNDWLSGDRGSDTITGGAGADIFHSFADAGMDRVTDFNLAEGDRVMLDPGSVYTVNQVGADTIIALTGGAQMVLVGVQASSLTGAWIFGA
ncbi:MAG: exsH [Phenylobacterium sp.]|nr:exsH [Phenylobacterium sp.]